MMHVRGRRADREEARLRRWLAFAHTHTPRHRHARHRRGEVGGHGRTSRVPGEKLPAPPSASAARLPALDAQCAAPSIECGVAAEDKCG
eukprot:3933349-Rhodomonas_salina.4